MVNTLTFVSDFGKYALDTIWSPGDDRYGESTLHMYASGEWTRGGQPTNRAGVIDYNDDLAGGASFLGVTNDPGTGAAIPTCNSWDFSIDLTIDSWPSPGSGAVTFLAVGGTPDPPYAPGATEGLSVRFNRSGFFSVGGQILSHTESTGVTFHGGTIGVHVEVTPGGLWWVQTSVNGALAYTACGLEWGGELYAASFGCMSVGGATPVVVLKSPFCSGEMGTAASPVECPHAPPVGATPRARAFWLPWGE